MTSEQGELVVYQAKDGQAAVDVRLKDETVRLTLNQLDEIFDLHKYLISHHLRNIFQPEELERSAVVAKNATAQKEGHGDLLTVQEAVSNSVSPLGFSNLKLCTLHFTP